MPEAIETVCTQSFVPTTDTPLTIGNVQAYLHLLQDAVTEEVGAQNAVTEEVDAQKGGSEDTTLYIS